MDASYNRRALRGALWRLLTLSSRPLRALCPPFALPAMNGSFLRKTLFSTSDPGGENHQARFGPSPSTFSDEDGTGTHSGRYMQLSREPALRHQSPQEHPTSENYSPPASSTFLDPIQRARQFESQRRGLGVESRFLSPQVHDREDRHSEKDGSGALLVTRSVSSLGQSRRTKAGVNATPDRSPHVSEYPKLRPFSQSKPAKSLRQRLEPGSCASRTLGQRADIPDILWQKNLMNRRRTSPCNLLVTLLLDLPMPHRTTTT